MLTGLAWGAPALKKKGKDSLTPLRAPLAATAPGAHGQQPCVRVPQEPALQVCVRGGVQVRAASSLWDGVKGAVGVGWALERRSGQHRCACGMLFAILLL